MYIASGVMQDLAAAEETHGGQTPAMLTDMALMACGRTSIRF